MAPRDPSHVDERLEILNAQVMDLLAHLEALVRRSRSVQQALLQLEIKRPLVSQESAAAVLAQVQRHAHEMAPEYAVLGELVEDFAATVNKLVGVES